MTCRLKVIHYCLQIDMKTLEISVLKYMNLIIVCRDLDKHENPL